MSFTAIFIALLIERFFDCSHLRRWDWYPKFQRFIMQKLSGQSSNIILAVTIVPILIVVLLVTVLISGIVFGFLKLAVSVLVILYCFGPRNLWADTFACLNAVSQGDASDVSDKLKMTFDVTETATPQAMHRQWINSIFIQANRRVFAAVFWFACIGLVGVVLYRLVSLSVPEAGREEVDPQVANAARRVESYLDWPPVRILTFIFALGGNYSKVLSCWRNKAMLGPETNDSMLTECGVAALNLSEDDKIPIDGSIEKDQINLLDRSLGIVLVVIAVLVFFNTVKLKKNNFKRLFFKLAFLFFISDWSLAHTIIVDDMGKTLVVKKPAQRIISLAPDITEILFSIGAGNKLIGIIKGSDYPLVATNLPQVGSYAGLDLEKIISLNPDLVVVWAGTFARQIAALEKMGIAVYVSKPRYLEDIPRTMKNLGLLTGAEKKAAQAADNFLRQLALLNKEYKGKKTISVFYQIDGYSLFTINKESWINQVLELCGGHNIFSDANIIAPEVSFESVVMANPTAIISTARNENWKTRWRYWPSISAVKENNLITISPDLIERAGPRLLEGATQICKQLQIIRTHH